MRWKGKWIVFEGPFEPLAASADQFSNKSNSSVLSISCGSFFDSNSAPFKASKQVSMDLASWKTMFKPEFGSCSFQWFGPSRQLYSKSFARVKAEIALGNWKKAVPIAFDRSSGTLSEVNKKYILSQVSNAPESLIPYGFWKQGSGMIGLTPEILFSREKNKLETMALAGTEKKQGPCHLLADSKNLKEHDFVVQDLLEKLKSFGKVEMYGPVVLELPTLYHLLTKFSIHLQKNWNDLESVSKLHPTSALGISPSYKWKELEDLPEQKTRNFFGAPFLLQIGSEESLALVALRQIQWDLNEVRIGAGGGVVQESEEEFEWLEILAKIDSVKKLMGIS